MATKTLPITAEDVTTVARVTQETQETFNTAMYTEFSNLLTVLNQILGV